MQLNKFSLSLSLSIYIYMCIHTHTHTHTHTHIHTHKSLSFTTSFVTHNNLRKMSRLWVIFLKRHLLGFNKHFGASHIDIGLIPGSGRSPGEGNGNPFQYSCLENSMDRGAWQGYGPWGCKRVRHDLLTKQQNK